MDAVRAALGEVAAAAEDPEVAADAVAEQAAGLLGDAFYAAFLAVPDTGIGFGLSIAAEVGEDRARDLTAAIGARVDGENGLAWLAVGLAEGAGDVDRRRCWPPEPWTGWLAHWPARRVSGSPGCRGGPGTPRGGSPTGCWPSWGSRWRSTRRT